MNRLRADIRETFSLLGLGAGALIGPALMAGVMFYASAPEADAPVEEHVAADTRKDYGVVWSDLNGEPGEATVLSSAD